jgi:Ni,Fe-hydrogenase III large subunit/Ni,Fe-hydrogenase III component G
MTAQDASLAPLRNGQALPLTRVPQLALDAFRHVLLAAVAEGRRVVACFGAAGTPSTSVEVYLILADDSRNQMDVARTCVSGETFPSLTPECPQMHLFEREIGEQFGIRPAGHPWFKPVRYRPSWQPARNAWGRPPGEPILPGVGDFYRVEGQDVHEVAVGPVHAGIIEPGHFRFQCHGEHVFHLEIALGYQHRGVEEAMPGCPPGRALHLAETLAGDTSIGHATAYCQAIEALGAAQAPVRGQALRAIALELERLANHIGDLGALANDVGFLPTSAYCGRIRGDALNMSALLCGNRFGRGLVRPGGVRFDADADRVAALQKRLDALQGDAASAINLLWESPSVLARFEGKGMLPKEICRSLGIVGLPARAAGIGQDARRDQPAGIYRFAQIPVSTWSTGDVFARAFVRWLEVQQSIVFIRDQLGALPGGPVAGTVGALKPRHLAATLVEGWRGELCHVAITGDDGALNRYKVVDPSFHNWTGLAYALRDQQISDFPLCNKSFNLSYCGHDL